MMTFNEYQAAARTTAKYTDVAEQLNIGDSGLKRFLNLQYAALGLAGEAGEIANKVKKIYRDKSCTVTDEARQELKKEVSDCLWYCAAVASELDYALDDIATENIAKLQSRLERGVITGSGDNR